MGERRKEVAKAAQNEAAKSEVPTKKPGVPVANSDMATKAEEARRNGKTKAEPVLAPGKAPGHRYEEMLGKWLGPELYKAVSGLITLDKLGSYAKSGVDSSLGALGKLIKSADPASAGEIDEAVAALKKALGPKAAAFVEANGEELQEALQDFVDANPLAIVLIAMLAAAGAVAADMEIPELKTTFNVTDNLDVTVAAKIGSLRDITLEKLYAKVEYEAGSLKASAAATYEPKKDAMKGEVGLDYKATDKLDLYGRGSWLMDVESGGKINPSEHTMRAGVRWKPKPRMALELYGEMDSKRGAGAGLSFSWKF